MPLPSEFDNTYFPLQREFTDNFIRHVHEKILSEKTNEHYIEIGSQDRSLIKSLLVKNNIISLDINDTYQPDIVADITTFNAHIPNESVDGIFCMEILEHVVDPFASIIEMSRILKDGGFLAISTPLNARIHGPVPDCWRFTEFGLRVLLRNFDIEIFEKLETPGRNLFPLHYAAFARKNSKKAIDPREMKFAYLD